MNLKAEDYAKLEKDVKFRRSYYSATKWWKNPALIAPIILMFGGLVGIMYLFNMDKLISLSVIPYLLLFAVGTILFKAIKMNLQKRKMAESGSFHICLAIPVEDRNGYTYAVFTNDTHRYNKHYIKNLLKDISLEDIIEKYELTAKNKSVMVKDIENQAEYYIRGFKIKELTKANSKWEDDGFFPVLFIDEADTLIVKSKDLALSRK